ncbi:unnamed protein product [Phytophthora fragariaefolia]|uniref:Unnamed protein product n=1 Tax=Phytophthora fragariaefolia TaxID=1490495 RepID=A0A9W6U593_9STRA|nr:unnamed protein product [Phytophthora fragariaefolia]
MSTRGDLYAKSCVATLTMDDLPRKNVLSMPRVARGDLVKVLDLVQCSRSEGQQWELVFTRWRNGMETWLPLEVVQLYASNLLQEFYVNSINSWAFHGRLQPATNLRLFRTEVELWLFHEEFQKFYSRLREKRAGGGTAGSQQRAVQTSTQVRVKPERVVPATNTTQTLPAHNSTPAIQGPVMSVPATVVAAPVATAAALTQHPVPPIVATALAASGAPTAAVADPSEAVIREFELRRLARERQEQLDEQRRNQRLVLHQQQQADVQRRQEHEQEEQQLRILLEEQERERRIQHERQRQKAHEVLHQKQMEYQQRLRVQQQREKLAEIQQQEQERQQRAQDQDQLRKRLQLNKTATQRTPTPRRPQEAATRTSLQTEPSHQGRQKNTTSLSKITKVRNSSSIWNNGYDDDYVPPESSESESEDSDLSASSETSERSNHRGGMRRRKRLLYSQVERDDEDDDEFPDLSQPPPGARRRNVPEDSSDDDAPIRKPTQTRKRRKRLHQSDSPMENGGASNIEVDLTQPSNEEGGRQNSQEISTVTPVVISEDHSQGKQSSDREVTSEPVEDDDVPDLDDDLDFEPSTIIGEIRCVCGAASVGGYRGQWLQCWKEDCGVWEHADCVGFLKIFETTPPPEYLCTRCDPEAYLARCVHASNKILDWLFQCCESRNSKQLMELLEDNTGATNLPSDWKNANYEGRTLAMHAARNGLAKCLRYLMDERKVDIFATDERSRNALHYAAIGGSVACCRLLLKRDRKLLLHQDLRGCMPFHCLLQSSKVNRLCIPFMREDSALVGMGDLDSNFPIHYACQAVNNYTVEICQMIFAAQPSMLQEKSSEGLHPLMILCKAAGGSTAVRKQSASLSQATNSAREIMSMMLDIDVFGDCLNETAPNGWSPLHFAAASGNHELVTSLCNLGLFDVDHAVKETGLTALHIAAQENHALCVRALLLEGLNIVAKDSDGWIPILYATEPTTIQEFMHYKLTKQLSRLHRMLSKYQQRELVRQWQQRVARDPTCFDILNDWCQCDPERIERMEGLLLSNPFLLRLDNKLEYIWRHIIPSIKKTRGQSVFDAGNGKSSADDHSRKQKKLAFVFTRERGCFWKQFIDMGMGLEPENFRLPIVFSIERGSANREGNLKLILIRLAAGLLKDMPGLLMRGYTVDLEPNPLSIDKQILTAQLLGYYLLGELVAHFVLYAVPISGILDFAPAFMRSISCKGKHKLAGDEHWEIAGRSFATGFEAVLPATLELFHADGLRVLFNGPETSLNICQIDWNTAVDWDIRGSETMENEVVENAKAWMPRLMSELVKEEQQLVLLFMTGTFQLVNEYFFRSEGGRITIASCLESSSTLDSDAMYPMMEYKPHTLRLPSYTCYEAFKKATLTVIRHVDQAFLPE